MTRVGLLAPLSQAVEEIRQRLSDRKAMRAARLHPVQVLSALLTYATGRGVRGSGGWVPVQQIIDALDSAFYLAFEAVVPTNKRTLLALDISGSMDGGACAGEMMYEDDVGPEHLRYRLIAGANHSSDAIFAVYPS